MISPKLTNCKECANIPDLLRRIDCKLAELGNNLYNNVVFMLNRPIATSEISQLLVYKRVLRNRFCDTHYAHGCPEVSTEDIASKVIRLTAGCVPHCGEPTVCEITTCPITPCPNPSTTSTSTTSTSTTSTTSTSSTTTTTTTLNCNFSGSIDCNITTTTTTTPAPTTSTTTTYFPDPFGVPCIWSTNGGNPGLVGVYDFDTNTATDVLVPNDFNETVGIERPICATEDKLWLASVVDQGSNTSNDVDDVVYIREWDIDGTTPNAPTLTYVREITVPTGQYTGSNLAGSSIWAMTAKDNDTLIVGTGNEYGTPAGTGGTGQFYGLEFSIAAAGDITVNNNDISAEWMATAGSGTGKISNLTYTNSGQLIVGYRLDLNPDGSGLSNKIGNYIRVFPTTPADPNFSINNQVIQQIKLQDKGYPEFTNTYTGVKDAPFWGVNGLAQVLQPETLQVYTLEQGPNYGLTLATSVNSSNDWLSSATHCSNIEFELADNPDCGLTYFPAFFDEDDNYLGPQTFEYNGMTVEAALTGNIDAFRFQGVVNNTGFLGCSGLITPTSNGQEVNTIVQGNNFQIQFTFPQPVNNIPIRAGVLNSNEDGTQGDVYEFSTNVGAPTLSINQGCFVQVLGNKLWGGVANPPGEPSAYNNEGDGEFLVTAPSDFTSMVIYGNAPTGGPLFFGCPPVNCDNMIFTRLGGTLCSEQAGRCVTPPTVPVEQSSYQQVFIWNKTTDTCTEVGPPPGTGFRAGDVSIGDNIVVVSAWYDNGTSGPASQTIERRFIKYDCTITNGIPSNWIWDEKQYYLPTVWDEFGGAFIPNIEVINDNQIAIVQSDLTQAPCWYDARFLVCTFPETGEEMIVEDKFQLACGEVGASDLVVTYKPDGVTPNKVLVLGAVEAQVEGNTIVTKLAVSQYDFQTGNLETVTKAEDFINTDGWFLGTAAALAIVDGELYAGSTEWAKIDWNYPYAWTQLPDNEEPCPAGGAGTIPACRITDGFEPSPITTTTTTTDPNTTTTTTTVSGVRTIFTKFRGPIENV